MCQEKEKPKGTKGTNLFKAVLFVALFLVIFASVSKALTLPNDHPGYQWVRGFYSEKEDSLDAVYIGSSATYTFWQAALGWETHGVAVWPYATSGQPREAARYIIEEARKTQPNALYIIDVPSGEMSNLAESVFHRVIDYMPWSITKLKLIHSLCEMGNYALEDRLEFYLPFYRYHSRWDELAQPDFDYKLDGTKGGCQVSVFLNTSKDVSGSYRKMDLSGDLSSEVAAYFEDLFDYIDREHIKVLFIANTGVTTSELRLAGINRIMELAAERGYPTLNLKDQQAELGLNMETDYLNAEHTNIHGSIKYTEYLASYLVENFGFQDKRGQEGYESWDTAVEKYLEIISPYVVKEELDANTYDGSIQAPELTALSVNGTTLTLRWKKSGGAKAYHIYRKKEPGQVWELIAEVTADTLSYEDTGLEVFQKYTYTVVPQGVNGGKYYHGNYNFAGISATTTQNAPELLELKGDGQAQTLSWDEALGADGYVVFRRIPGKNWIEVADVGNVKKYTDTNLFGGEVPFIYTVRAYVLNEEDNRSWSSSFDSNGLLWLPQIQDIGLTASVESGRISLLWEKIYGAGKCYLYRREKTGEWTQITEPLSGETTSFEDITAEKGVSYQYRVTAALNYSGKEHQFATQETGTWYQATQDSVAEDRPEIVFAEQIGQSVELVWTPASNANAYRIYKKIGESDWKVLNASVTGNTYSDQSKTGGEEAFYIVQALYKKNGAVFYGDFSEDMAVTVCLEQEE